MLSNDAPTRGPNRGVVIKSFHPVKALAGFMDDAHFQAFAQEYLATLSEEAKADLLAEADRARTIATALPPHPDFSVESRPVDPEVSEQFTKDETFRAVFGGQAYHFAWVRLENLVALQVFVNAQEEDVPSTESALTEFSLPGEWSVPAEITFIPPLGPIYIVSSSPHLVGLRVRTEVEAGQIIIEPPTHINVVQVMHFNGRYYLRNGYHRVVGALRAGVTELPALIVEGNQPAEVELANMGPSGFGVLPSMMLPRPALVADFNGTATVEIRMRERRYGASVSLQISPVNIGV